MSRSYQKFIGKKFILYRKSNNYFSQKQIKRNLHKKIRCCKDISNFSFYKKMYFIKKYYADIKEVI